VDHVQFVAEVLPESTSSDNKRRQAVEVTGSPPEQEHPHPKKKRQQQEEGTLMQSQVFFDPNTIIASHLAIEGIDIGTSFRKLQEEAAPVISDAKKMLTLHLLPCFL
jgi:hypothetical protein